MTAILDASGKPFEKSVLSEPQTAKLGWLARDLQMHQVAGLTPSRMVAIFNEAEQGNIVRQSELFEDMEERDGHLAAELGKRQRAILTVDWTIEPPLNPSAEEKAWAEELDGLIRGIEIMDDVLTGMSSAIGRGFSCQEIDGWELLDKRWVPKAICFRPQTWFTLDHETRSEIRLRSRDSFGDPLAAFGWIVHRHMAKPGYLARGALHRQLAWPFLWKNYSVGDLLEFLEIYGLPMRVGTYPTNATEAERATLLKAVVNIGHDAAGIIPEGMLIDFKEAAKSGGGNDPFMTMIEWCERTQSKVLLGGTLTSQADGKSSTNALGNVHNEVRHDLLVSDTRFAAKTIREQLLYPISVLSGKVADIRRAPRIVFDTQEEEDFQMLAESLPKLVDMGMKIPQKHAHELLRIPMAQDGEAVLEAKKPEPKPTGAPDPAKEPFKKKPTTPVQPEKLKADIFMAALLKANEQGVYPDQAELDRAVDALSPEQLQAMAEEALGPVIEKLKAQATPEEAMAMLAAMYPEMNNVQLEQSLARAIFVADIWGRLNADA